MQRMVFLVLPLCVLLTSCGQSPPKVVSEGCTIHKIPDDPNNLRAVFHQTGDKYDYIVLAYGKKDVIQARPKNVVVNDKEVSVPAEGGVYVLDPTLKLHKAAVAASDLQKLLWSGNATDLPESKVWREELYPMLKKHAWNEQGK